MFELSVACKTKIDEWTVKFPKKRSAILMALRVVQKEHGWLPDEALSAVANYLSVPLSYVSEVVSFYSMYDRVPVGKYKIAVCNSLSCYLCQSNQTLQYLEKKLNIKVGETTKDGLFTLKVAECLAACDKAPVILVGDDNYYENMTPDKIDELLESLKQENENG